MWPVGYHRRCDRYQAVEVLPDISIYLCVCCVERCITGVSRVLRVNPLAACGQLATTAAVTATRL